MNNTQEPLTKKEQKAAKYQEKLGAREGIKQERLFKRIAFRSLAGVLIAAAIGGLIWYVSTIPEVPGSVILSRSGFHWHPELVIYVKEVKQEIPADIGIGVIHQPIHTHDDTGVIHMEFSGVVRKRDTVLGEFFKNWGKDMRSFGADMKMTVNGKKNIEYENYLMQDQDKIELRFD